MRQHLDAAAIRRWAALARAALEAHRQEIDDLNVYPVPDGDTGTNLLMTMQAVEHAVAARRDDDGDATLRALAEGALMGARGNSGVILSQVLRGAAEVVATAGISAASAKVALRRAADLAYAAVSEPVEGTILTVARAAADGAEAASSDDAATVVRVAARAAADALARTPQQLAALARAGVVDAGGRGLCVLLDSLVSMLDGHPEAPTPGPVVPRDGRALVVAREGGSSDFAYEVQYLLRAPDDRIAPLKAELGELGDSLVVVGGDGLYNVHVHVNDVGAALEAGVLAGRPERISVTRFDDQIRASDAATPGATMLQAAGVLGTSLRAGTSAGRRAVVVVAPGPGLAATFESVGARAVTGGATMNPSTGELLAAIEASGAAEVVLLPNDGNVHGAAAQAAAAARERGWQVRVIPTRSPVQGLAALAVHDRDRDFGDDIIAMTAAAGATRWAEVTVAVRDAQTSAGMCRAGDVLGLLEGDVAVIGHDLTAVALEVVDRLLLAGGEIVTLVAGATCDADVVDRLREHLHRDHPTVEVEVHDGGQPHYPLLLGVE
ncbi:MAG: DAK2 domain-containing protein [Mycobacteriales bacterium]|nr:DAK2 domain-containing protein [Frankia sp.]